MRHIVLCFVALQAVHTFGQQSLALNAPAYGSPFLEIKTYQEQAFRLGGTKTQIRANFRNSLEAKYGSAGVEKMFQAHSPSPDIAGIAKTIRLATSDNPNQAKGYKRTLLYEKEFTRGGKFEAIATDKIIQTRFGETDVDLWLRHRETGENVLVEVKDSKLANQNIKDYKLKVRRFTDYAERHGARVAFLSRNELKPAFKEFAKSHGVLTYDKVVTGKLTGQKQGNLPFREMERDLGQRVAKATTTEAGELAEFETAGIWLRRAGTAVMVAYEGYAIQGALSGRLSEREFWTANSKFASVAAGSWVGMKAGAAAGGALGAAITSETGGWGVAPGALFGGVIGILGGGYGGAKLGEMAASGYYGRLDDNQKHQVEAFICQQYGVAQ